MKDRQGFLNTLDSTKERCPHCFLKSLSCKMSQTKIERCKTNFIYKISFIFYPIQLLINLMLFLKFVFCVLLVLFLPQFVPETKLVLYLNISEGSIVLIKFCFRPLNAPGKSFLKVKVWNLDRCHHKQHNLSCQNLRLKLFLSFKTYSRRLVRFNLKIICQLILSVNF